MSGIATPVGALNAKFTSSSDVPDPLAPAEALKLVGLGDMLVRTGLVTVENIAFYSFCGHHFSPFFGAASVTYQPGEIITGHIPPYSVVVPGSLPGKPLPDGSPGPSLACAVIVKTVDAQTREKTGINDLLRD